MLHSTGVAQKTGTHKNQRVKTAVPFVGCVTAQQVVSYGVQEDQIDWGPQVNQIENLI
jgi:hypothetical protein